MWNKTSATIPGNGYCGMYPDYSMPCKDEWAYQANADSIDINFPNNNARLTWRTQFGFLGQTSYDAHDPSQRLLPGYPKKSYSTYVVLGTHSSAPVEAEVGQVETVQSLTLTTNNGSVITSGPAGVADSAPVSYAPAGYNHIYGALAFNANSNQLDANIAVGSGTLTKPLIIISNFTAASYPTVQLAGLPLTADVDYFASLRSDASELWITLNRNLSGAMNHLEIISSSGPPAAPTGLSTRAITTSRIDLTWNAINGATYQVDRESSLAGGFVQIAMPMTNSFSDTGLQPTTAAYIYRVRAVNGAGTSPNSSPRLSTTIVYTDNALAAGILIKAMHLAELRSAVNAARALAVLGAAGFTDAAAPGTLIRALHITQLRSALDEALPTLGFTAGGYTDAVANGVAIKAVHFQELRDRME